MASILITGANRGIGLGLVKHILEQNGPLKIVLATYRNADSATKLMDLKKQYSNLHLLKLDVSKLESFKEFAKEVESIVGENGLNVLINNAGVAVVGKSSDLRTASYEEYLHVFNTNYFGSVFLSQALLPLILTAAKNNSDKPAGITRAAILNMSSLMGSIADNGTGGYCAYRESKAALNQFSRNLAKELFSEGVVALALHPGHVRTDMGGPNGKISVEESVLGLYKLLESLNESHSDKFIKYDGKELPW